MAHKRQDTYVEPVEWWKHLRRFNKQVQNHKERQAAKEIIKKEKEDVDKEFIAPVTQLVE